MSTQLGSIPAKAPVPPSSLLLSDKQLAGILLLTRVWIRTHAEELPGLRRFGSYVHFSRDVIEEWLGGSLEPVLDAKGAAALMGVPDTWVYPNADDIPGVLRLGHYVRFRPAILIPFLKGSKALVQ